MDRNICLSDVCASVYQADGVNPVSLTSVFPGVTALEQVNNKYNGGCDTAVRPQNSNAAMPKGYTNTHTHTETIHMERHKSTLTVKQVLRNPLY